MKNIKKNLYKTIAVVFVLICVCFSFAACSFSFGNTQSNIEISQDGYWIINGEKTGYKAIGKDGKDAPQFTILDAYHELVNSENYEGSFSDFIKEYFDFSIDLTSTIAKSCKSSVVSINFNNDYRKGSGVAIKKDNEYTYFLTNYHVISTSLSSYSIKLYHAEDSSREQPMEAEFVSKNEEYDLALVKVLNQNIFKEISVANISSKGASEGDTCIAIGNTHNKGIAITLGNVSKLNDSVAYTNGGQTYEVLRHCAYIEKGSSGGGLFNLAGELIGITNAGEGNDVTLMNYAIPSDHVLEFLNEVFNNL